MSVVGPSDVLHRTPEALSVRDLHAMVYGDLLPRAVSRMGRAKAELLVLRFKVLGGLGPLATVDFIERLLHATPASRDREHLRLDIKIDPIMGILTDVSPIPVTQAALGRLLADESPTVFCLPCNTAHWRIDQLNFDRKTVQFVSMIDATVDEVLAQQPSCRRVGLLATSRLIALDLYQKAFEARGISVAVPTHELQECIDVAIYGGRWGGREYRGIKGGDKTADSTALVQHAVDHLCDDVKLSAICLSCTELPLVFGPQLEGSSKGQFHGRLVINSTQALAHRFLHAALLMQAGHLRAALSEQETDNDYGRTTITHL
jgi:aspartate racemase